MFVRLTFPLLVNSVVPGVFYPGSCLRSSDLLGSALPPRLDFSIVDTFAYSRLPSKHSSFPRFGSHVFRGGGAPTLLTQARLPRKTLVSQTRIVDFAFLGCITASQCCWQACMSASTSSRINRCHEGTLVHARTL